MINDGSDAVAVADQRSLLALHFNVGTYAVRGFMLPVNLAITLFTATNKWHEFVVFTN